MIPKKISILKNNLPLLILVFLLLLIDIVSLKPQFSLLGWDNFSSYLNLKTNLFRTFFSVWREYRSLGVPSDSEVVDLFRQIFYLILSPFLKETLLDQIYVLTCLNLGVFGVYFLAKKILGQINLPGSKMINLSSSVAAFFYLFNLNTMATFYFPMVMYITRFATLPWMFLIFYKLINEKEINSKTWLFIFLFFFFSATSYLTATIFITLLLMLGVSGLFLGHYFRQLLFTLIFLCLNLYWLLPFVNYTLEKSKIIPLAPNFIDTNETQFNKPSFYYSPDRLLLFYPNFLDTKVTTVAEDNFISLHPQARAINTPPNKIILFVFPALYLTGAFLLIVKYRKKELFWIPLILFLSFLFVGKGYTPFGFFYNLIEGWIPYFNVIFRFADTKFNIFGVFVGCLASAITIQFLFSKVENLSLKPKTIFFSIILFPFLLTIFIFPTYLSGQLLGFFIYNKIPDAYFKIAKQINNDEDDFRVLHLPLSKNGYWKFYTWGASGSSFLNFMLNKPLIDSTFEPASMENALLDEAIFGLINNAQIIDDPFALGRREEQLYELLKRVGVKYLIFDGTINNSVYAKGIAYWGKFNTFDSLKMVNKLKESGRLELVEEYPVIIPHYLNLYPYSYPLDQKNIKLLTDNPIQEIKLFKLANFSPKLYFAPKAELVDPKWQNILTGKIFPKENYLQNFGQKTGLFFPFQRDDFPLEQNEKEIKLNLEDTPYQTGKVILELPQERTLDQRHLIEVFARLTDHELVISFQRLVFPIIQGQKINENLGEIRFPLAKIKSSFLDQNNNLFTDYFSNWHVLGNKKISLLRLGINDFVLPIPQNLNSNDVIVSEVMLPEGKLMVDLLDSASTVSLDLTEFQTTDDPNCFQDRLNDYQYEIEKSTERLTLSNKNGSACIIKPLNNILKDETFYFEINLEAETESQDLDSHNNQNFPSGQKPQLKNYLFNQPKPAQLRICLLGNQSDECYNPHQVLRLRENQKEIIPLTRLTHKDNNPKLLFSSMSLGYQKQRVTINRLTVNQFKKIAQTEFEILPKVWQAEIFIDKEKEVDLKFPKALSLYSYFHDKTKDGYYLSNLPCTEKNSYRTFRIINNRLVSFFENCSNLTIVPNFFDSNNFYLWGLNYHLFSGKYPKYLLSDGFHFYKDSYVSLGQGYPNVPFFRDLQQPESFLTKLNKTTYKAFLQQTFSHPAFTAAYTYLYPEPEIYDQTIKNYTLHHDSENEGVLALDSMEIAELPNSWANLVIKTQEIPNHYSLPKEFSYRSLLPSLKNVKLKNETDKTMLLVFNEGYDRQWEIYSNLLNLFLGKKLNSSHFKFNGYAHAWEIKPENENLYIFYTPERLAVIGWGITLLTFLIGLKILPKIWLRLNS